MGPSMGPHLLKGIRTLAPVLEVVYNGVMMSLEGFRIRGPYWGTTGSTLDFGPMRRNEQ